MAGMAGESSPYPGLLYLLLPFSISLGQREAGSGQRAASWVGRFLKSYFFRSLRSRQMKFGIFENSFCVVFEILLMVIFSEMDKYTWS